MTDEKLAQEAWEAHPTYLLELACNHKVSTGVLLRMQYPDDQHFVRCPKCNNDHAAVSAWHEVTSCTEVKYDVRQLLSEVPFVLSRHILRVQFKVPLSRCRPFPYK